MPPPARFKLRWIWLIGLLAVPLLAIGFTLVFMNQPPAGGPWSHLDLFSLRDFAFWLVIALAIWTLFVAGIAAARYRGTSVEAPLLMCALPGLFMVALLPSVRKVDCPSQIPRGDMLEPIPPGATITKREQSSFRGSATLIQQIEAPGESSDDLERRAADFYIAEGWRLESDDGFIVKLAAGDWHLSVSGQKDYQAPGGPKDLGVQLGLTHFDDGCDWLS